VNLGSVVFKAWNEKDDPDMLAVPDAIWTIGNGDASTDVKKTSGSSETASTAESNEKYIGLRPSGTHTYVLGGGSVAEGSVKIYCYNPNYQIVDMVNGKYDNVQPGDPEEAQWYYNIFDKGGKLVWGSVIGEAYSEMLELGTVDYETGLVTIDFDKLTGWGYGNAGNEQATTTTEKEITVDEQNKTVEVVEGSSNGSNPYHRYLLDTSYVRINWTSQAVGLTAQGKYRLSDADAVSADAKSHGHVREGKNTFICFTDANGDGNYTPGELFGVVRGVDVGWQGASFTVELTETSAITPRIALWGGEAAEGGTGEEATSSLDDTTSDRGVSIDDINKVVITDRTFSTNEVANILTRVDTTQPPADGKATHIRVVRYGIDDMFCYMAGVYTSGVGEGFNQQVVMDKTFDPSGRDFLCEADFLGEDQFDIDWGTMTGTDFTKGAIVNVNGVALGSSDEGPMGAGCKVTNMTYLVVVGDGKKDFRGSSDTNTVRALATVVTRRFELTRTRPTVDTEHKMFYSARPTFTWSMAGEDAWASKFGSTYTAFRLQILSDANPDEVVYDSGIVRAPKQDKAGNFVWTAPVCAGSLTSTGKVFEPLKTYKWHVTMYNAKFRSNYWSSDTGMDMTYGSFTMDVNRQQKVNDHTYSSIDVAVKYVGPTLVAAKVAAKSGDTYALKGKVRVQAFERPDFSGEPVAETFVTERLTASDNALPNATLVGLPADGTYFVRAFIDLNGNGKLDAWESWGALESAVTFGPDVAVAPSVGFYIEDADTDQDWLPDAWEYAVAGWTGDFDDVKNELNAALEDGDVIAVTDGLKTRLSAGTLDAGLSSGLPGASLTVFQNASFARVLLGIPTANHSSFDAIRDAVKATVEENSLKVTSLTVTQGKVTLTVDAEVSCEIPGLTVSTLYDLKPYASVTLKIYRKNTLLDEKWTLETTVTKSFAKGQETVDISVPDIDFTSGFYKVEVAQ